MKPKHHRKQCQVWDWWFRTKCYNKRSVNYITTSIFLH